MMDFIFGKVAQKKSVKNDQTTIRIFYSSSNYNCKIPYTPNCYDNIFKFGWLDEYQRNNGKDIRDR